MPELYNMTPEQYQEALNHERLEVFRIRETAIDGWQTMVDQPIAIDDGYYAYCRDMYLAAQERLEAALPERERGLLDDRSWFYICASVVEYGIALFSNTIKKVA